jgi:hypothetical protein
VENVGIIGILAYPKTNPKCGIVSVFFYLNKTEGEKKKRKYITFCMFLLPS